MGFEETFDVEQVFPALGASPFWIRGCPNFPLQHVFDGGYRKLEANDFADGGAFDKVGIARVSLKLHAQI